MRAGLLGALLLCVGCGAAPGSGARMPMSLYLDGAFPFSQLSSFQIAIATQGSSYDCAQVQTSCFKGEVDTPLVPVTDANGVQQKALLVPVNLVNGTPETQDATVNGIAVGKDYLVVIEALSNENPPRLLGSSCNQEPEIRAGNNPPLLANAINAYPGGPVGCDPRF